jgi:DNA-binding CsgD family transcriptional regulator
MELSRDMTSTVLQPPGRTMPAAVEEASPISAAVIAQFVIDGTRCMVVDDDSYLGRAFRADHDVVRTLGQMHLEDRLYVIYARTERRADTAAESDPIALLTAREQQIIRLVCQGCVNKQIAYRLRISEYTVKTYLKQIFCKLNVHSRSAMAYRCAPWVGADNINARIGEK